jgi:hypothetical protein
LLIHRAGWAHRKSARARMNGDREGCRIGLF